MTPDLVPVPLGAAADVAGAVYMASDGALVVRLSPTRAQNVTAEPEPEPQTFTELGFMRYMGRPTPEQAQQWHAEIASYQERRARPWWRRWSL